MQYLIDKQKFFIRQALPDDFDAILHLQKTNTPRSLTEKEKRQQGYIISEMTREHLQRINENVAILVACENGHLIGFVCLTPKTTQPCPPVVAAMLNEASAQKRHPLLFGKRVFLYGPVCIAKAYRGRGVLRQLFEATKKYLYERYDTGIAFIADDNPHSLAAHVQGLGMCDISIFSCDGKQYHLIAFSI